MLYDNALLILAYCKAYSVTKKPLYLEIAEKTASYIIREMTSAEGGFYSSQDADIEGEEGKYYLFTPSEIVGVLGKNDGEGFNRRFDITDGGNFEGKNIPNLLKSDPRDTSYDKLLPLLEDYRRRRYSLRRDEKILTAWNGLMIAAMSELYLVSKKETYLSAAKKADRFINKYLSDSDCLYVSFHMGKRGVRGFLDDYAAYILAQLSLYRATFENEYLDRARSLCDKVISNFGDNTGGFYLYGEGHEELILRPKESYDGAIPSGNSLMAYNLVKLSHLTDEEGYKRAAEKQLGFLAGEASKHPVGHAMFLKALLEYERPPMKLTIVVDDQTEISSLPLILPYNTIVVILPHPTKEYPLKNSKTTYYVCRGHSCLPPSNDLNELFENMHT